LILKNSIVVILNVLITFVVLIGGGGGAFEGRAIFGGLLASSELEL
jgi:hypothetical protein